MSPDHVSVSCPGFSPLDLALSREQMGISGQATTEQAPGLFLSLGFQF